ncbi:MAG: EamA family transporter [Longimicrobiaceae bacterium]
MGYLYVVCAAVLWGVLGPVSRVALQEGLNPLEVAFWRAVFAAVLFGAHAALLGRARVERRDLPAVAGFGLVGVAFLYVAYFMAVREGGAALASVLLYTAPVWVALLAALFLRERPGARQAAALGLAFAGVAGIALTSGGGGGVRVTPAALGWGLASGLAYALYYLFGKRFFARYDTSTLFLYALPVGALALLPLVDFAPKSPRAWMALAFVAAVPTYGSYLFYGAGLRRIDATRAATVAMVEPVVAAVAAYLAWGERWSLPGYLFAALVLAGVLLMVSEREPVAPHPEHA